MRKRFAAYLAAHSRKRNHKIPVVTRTSATKDAITFWLKDQPKPKATE